MFPQSPEVIEALRASVPEWKTTTPPAAVIVRFETSSGIFRELGPFDEVELRGGRLIAVNDDEQIFVASLDDNGRWQLQQNAGGVFELARVIPQ